MTPETTERIAAALDSIANALEEQNRLIALLLEKMEAPRSAC